MLVLIVVVLATVVFPLLAFGGVRLVERGDERRLKHRQCLANIVRLERELGIAGAEPYVPHLFSQFPVPRMEEIGRSGKVEYQKLLDDMEPVPHYLEWKDGAEVDLDRDLQPKPPTTIEARHG